MSNRELAAFNVLTSAWVPLLGQPSASLVELWSGERDGTDLDWPRDDFKIFTRLLLSALTQALFPAATTDELLERLDAPLPRAVVDARVAAVRDDFDLVPEGRPGFLQSAPRTGSDGAARFVFGTQDLVQGARVEAIGLGVATVALFTEQAYAGGAGRGYGAGPGGQPGVMTLIDAGSVRRSMWANTLVTEGLTPPDPPQAWNNRQHPPRNRGLVGLVEGLFFQPRAIWLRPASGSVCSFNGAAGPTVELQGFLPKNGLDKDKSALWVHPNAALMQKTTGLAPVRLDPSQPTWTGLAQLLKPISKGERRDVREGPARVLTQWRSLDLARRDRLNPRLLLLDYDRDKAILRGVFYEAFPLTDGLERHVEKLRELSGVAAEAASKLARALTDAHDEKGKRNGFAVADALAEFWRSTEPAFLDWLSVAVRNGGDDDMATARQAMLSTLRSVAIARFDAQVELSEFDLRKQSLIAAARARLRRDLYSLGAPPAEPTSTRPAKTPKTPKPPKTPKTPKTSTASTKDA
jgi:CRISPR type I-E-associated protein CasA/Cse1